MEAFFVGELGIALLVIIYIFVARRGANLDPFSAVVPFMAFYFLNYIARGMDLFVGLSDDYTGMLSENIETLLPIAHKILIGIISFAIGFIVITSNKRAAEFLWEGREISSSRVTQAHAFLLLLGFAACFILVVKAGTNPLNYIADLNYYRLNINNDVAYLKFLINLPGLTGVLLYSLACKNRERASKILLILPFFLNFFFAHRHFAVYYIFSLITVHHYLVRQFTLRAVVSFALIAFVSNGLFGAVRDFAYVFPGQDMTFDKILEAYSNSGSILDVILYHTYFSGFTGFDAVYKVVDAVDYNEGFHFGWRFLVEPIAGAIPYSIWPDKPVPLNTAINNLINAVEIDYYDPSGAAGGIVGTVLGDLYWAGGLVGIIVGMTLIGMLFRLCHNLIIRRNAFSVFIYSIYYPVLFMFISTIASGVIRLVYFSVIVALLYSYIVIKNPRVGGKLGAVPLQEFSKR